GRAAHYDCSWPGDDYVQHCLRRNYFAALGIRTTFAVYWFGVIRYRMAAMEQLTFNYKSRRGAKARLARHLQGTWLHLLTALVFILLFGGVALIASSQVIGWLALGLAALPAMIVGWYEGELKRLEPMSSPRTVD